MANHATGTARRFLDQLDKCESCLRQLLELSTTGKTPNAAAIRRMRQTLDDDLVSLVLENAKLQDKANTKLGHDTSVDHSPRDIWWVTERALQQATPWQVAQLKSQWYPPSPVADLCCGIGGDASHIARRTSVIAVDQDPLVAAMAEANLLRHREPNQVNVVCDDVTRINLPESASIHVDPDRRGSGRRAADPRFYQPPWEFVEALIRTRASVVKLAPAAPLDPDSLPREHHRCWISLQRTVREQSLLSGQLVERLGFAMGGRSAFVVASDATYRSFSVDDVEPRRIPSTQPQAVLVDPDPAIRAAGLTEHFAERFGLTTLGGPSGFLTSDHPLSPDWTGRAFAITANIVWHGPCDLKKIRRELRDRNAFAMTAKVRGTDHDPVKILKPLRRTGENPLALWIGRCRDRVYAALTEPLVSETD